MADSAIVPLLSYLGWSFLPNLASQFLQSIYYRLTISAGTPPPQPGTAVYARDHRRIRILVLCLYLLYTLLQSLYDIKVAGDFYTLLSVSPYTTTEKEIKSRLRRLAARYHPDKLAQSPTANPNDDGESSHIFLQLRLASETLTNPSHKYAYTHFGPNILTHLPKPETENQTAKQLSLQTAQLVTIALKQKIPSYISTLAFVFILNTFFLPGRQGGKFWRYLIISASFALEFYLLTHDVPALPAVLDTTFTWLRTHTKLGNLVPPHLLPFQILDISGKLALSLNIFISQISVLFPRAAGLAGGGSEMALVRGWMQQLTSNLGTLSAASTRIDQEASSLLQLQFAPYKGQPGHVRELRRGMKEGMVMGSIRSHPEVRDAVRRVIDRRKRLTGQVRDTRSDGADVVDLLNSDEQFT